MPLESKIPMVPGPEGAYNFTRRKVGKELWIPAKDAEFNLSDPYSYEMELTYDSLHDRHLVPYFSRPNNIKHLIKAGLVTRSLDAKCSLRDYNMYRKYLRRLHCDSIKKELNRRSKWSTEERAIQYAQEQAEKEVKRLTEREKLMKLRTAIIRSQKIAEKLKLQRQKEKQEKIEERLHALLLRKQEAQNLQRVESKKRAEQIQQKQKAAADRERHKIIQTLLEWRRKEQIRKRTRDTRLAHEREEKRKMVEQKWEERQEFQRGQIEKEQFLLQCIEDRRKDFIEAYNNKVNREAKRMEKLLQDVKMFLRCYLARRYAGRERICCKKDFDDDDDMVFYLNIRCTSIF
ncbi:fibrous sheath-interacting protein 2 [Colletes gigas]|uniref:fibrous sheath-interacting protein 2 n=1 Tax=Colletes gigas TaxID=935657 RepID=UPI001C9B5910|nr:fibrous sheath-interacting protein 2 [Colletes gigas]